MPELPEVETMVRDLVPRVVGRRIVDVEATFPGAVAYPDFPAFADRVHGQEIVGISRRGKYALFPLLSGDLLIIHRGMSGSLLYRRPSDPMEPYVRLLFRLDDGAELRFNDPRKFGKIFVMQPSGTERMLPWAAMGPEPLNGAFTSAALRERVRGRTALIKPLLLNQRVVAGLGNIYVDEALYLAGIHPERRAGTLTAAETERLHHAIRTVLAAAIGDRGTTFNNYTDIEGRRGGYQDNLRVFHKQGTACGTCGATIVKMVVQGRGTHLCPHCQRA